MYNPKTIESHWRKFWLEKRIYQPDLTKGKKPFGKTQGKPYYNLMMFPYPSAEGLHVGNMYAFTGADVHGRFKRMQGFDVFQPIGLDGFGIHSENYAIKVGRHPKEHAKISEKHFYEQLHMIGNGFAWDQKLETYDPDYYRWTQWLFVQMYKHGLAYRKKAMVNWCPSCKTVLSDEQVEGGVCERCKTPTTRKETEQWFFKITAYADQLLNNIPKLNWPKKITIAQQNWIGKTKGLNISFKIEGSDAKIVVWTKFWETVFGVTFLVVAPEHQIVASLLSSKSKTQSPKLEEIRNYVGKALKKTEQKRKAGEKDKTGVFTGIYAINPVNGQKIPVWISDYVLTDVGTGAVMGVPSHDLRDFDFAKKYDLEIKQVVAYSDQDIDVKVKNGQMAYEGEGVLVNSGEFKGLSAWGVGKQKMADWMIKKKSAKWKTTYHLRDWLISRQRYWGPPIPMIFCEKCGWQPVPEDQLPVLLPDIKDFQPKGDGKSPLQRAPKEWLETVCPKCGGKAKRETDVSDTFLDSAWYFLKYPSIGLNSKLETRNSKQFSKSKLVNSKHFGFRNSDLELPWNPEITRRWLPVNAYIGGAEHAVLHLLYARFVWMCFKDWGYLSSIESDEPFPFLFSHGLIIKDGAKMSKSRGNVVNPDEYISRYGADALRMYLMFLGSYDQGGDFRNTGMAGMYRFLERVWRMFQKQVQSSKKNTEQYNNRLNVILHKTIKKVTEDVAKFKYNTAIAALMEFMNAYEEKTPDGKEKTLSTDDAGKLIKLMAPFTPYLAEEIWHNLYPDSLESIHTSLWPEYDPKMLEGEQVEIPVQINGKTRAVISVNPPVAKSQPEMVKIVMEDQRTLQYLRTKKIVKIIFVANKIINLIVS
ncbi:leucine--tRNA ligase [Candidatus Collierbacteria bacterium]|nr:leucine--tRNA ligase [Candidatus Collierbacteria bacterium]